MRSSGHMSQKKFNSNFWKSVLFQRFLVCKGRPWVTNKNLEIRRSRMDGIPEWAEYFLGVNIQNFSSASNNVFSLWVLKKWPPRQGSLEKAAFSGCRRATTSREIRPSARIYVISIIIEPLNRKPRRLTRRSRATSPQSCSLFNGFSRRRIALRFDLQREKINYP